MRTTQPIWVILLKPAQNSWRVPMIRSLSCSCCRGCSSSRLPVGLNQWRAISFYSTRYDIDTIWGFFLDTIRYDTISGPHKKTFFLMNFRRIFRIFGEFSEISANFLNFRRISGEFSEFPENFRIFRRIFGGKRQNKGISRAYRDTRYGRFDTIYSSIYEKVRYIGIR